MLNKAVINLSTLKENAMAVKSLLPSYTKFCAVIKADAYGHGAPTVANALYNIVDCFAVALVEEGIELRRSGINKDILIMTPVYPFDKVDIVRFNLIASVSSIKEISVLKTEARKQGKIVRVHIKYNTGMNRQGVDRLSELEKILKIFSDDEWINIDGIYSHFAAPENKKARREAENKFLLANNLVKRYNNKATSHISASGGALKGVYFDMVRIGILLYGYKPFKSSAISVKPIMRIYVPIIKKRRIKRGESALYGCHKVEKNTNFYLVRYGYADGLQRVKISGLINNRCMDVSGVVGDKRSGRFTCVMEDAEKLAKKYKTISYEILTSAARRAEKIYIETEEK